MTKRHFTLKTRKTVLLNRNPEKSKSCEEIIEKNSKPLISKLDIEIVLQVNERRKFRREKFRRINKYKKTCRRKFHRYY